MEYFLSHIGVIFIAAILVALVATGWWLLTEKNARLIRQRAKAKTASSKMDRADSAGLGCEDDRKPSI